MSEHGSEFDSAESSEVTVSFTFSCRNSNGSETGDMGVIGVTGSNVVIGFNFPLFTSSIASRS